MNGTTVTTSTGGLNWLILPLQIGAGIAVAHIFTRILGLIGI